MKLSLNILLASAATISLVQGYGIYTRDRPSDSLLPLIYERALLSDPAYAHAIARRAAALTTAQIQENQMIAEERKIEAKAAAANKQAQAKFQAENPAAGAGADGRTVQMIPGRIILPGGKVVGQ